MSRRSNHSLPELFDKALAYGGHTHSREDIADGVKSGRFQYWGDDRCCLITEIHDFPQCRKLHLFIAAGDLDRLFDKYLSQVKQFAREHGCSGLTSVSRRGFLRRFPAYGFKPKSVTFELELKD
mgnify:CR=1 FL=1